MKRSLILVEGQTEERFVKEVMAPHCMAIGLLITPTILTTKVVKSGKNFKGGVTSFGKFESDLRQLLGGAGSDAIVTTILDYHGLPDDFPGMSDRQSLHAPLLRVQHVEHAIQAHFGDRRLLPFLALHEFEAWVFSCPNTIPNVVGADSSQQQEFGAICNSSETPEEINERPGSHPSARIKSLFPGYRKVLHGSTAAKRIGLSLIQQRCPHFKKWVGRLEAFARSA